MRSVEWVESAWDEDERAWMLALADWEAGLCPECGNDPRECQSPDADPDNPQATWIYAVKLPRVCHVGTAMRKARTGKADDPRALVPQVVKVRRGTPITPARDSRGRFTART